MRVEGHATEGSVGYCLTRSGYQRIEAQGCSPRGRDRHGTDLALSQGDNLAFEGEEYAGHGHHTNHQAGHNTYREVQPEDDLAQLQGRLPSFPLSVWRGLHCAFRERW